MIQYLIQRFCILIFSVWGVVTATFFLMHAIPGDPFIGEQLSDLTVLHSLRNYYGLDLPLWVQYGKYLGQLARGDLGVSIIYHGHSVNEFIRSGFPISVRLGLQALVLAVPCGVLLGSWAAMRRAEWQDHGAMVLSTLAISVPNFVLSSFLQWLFAVKLHWLPVAKWGSFEQTILPTIALAAMPTAFIARLIRANMVEILQQDYIRTARAKGLPLFQIAMRHGLRNALLPVITYLGPVTVQILTGSFMVERIFSIPGIGQWMILSINARDYPMVLGFTIFFSVLLMSMMFLVDLIYSFVDPRIRCPAVRKSDG